MCFQRLSSVWSCLNVRKRKSLTLSSSRALRGSVEDGAARGSGRDIRYGLHLGGGDLCRLPKATASFRRCRRCHRCLYVW